MKAKQPAPVQVTFQGKDYSFDGRGWVNAKTFERPPTSLVVKLEGLAAEAINNRDQTRTDVNGLISDARSAREARQLSRAVSLARRAFELSSGSAAAAAALSAGLREQGKPEEALSVTDGIENPTPAVLTTRAAALCDLRRWEDAKKAIARALAQGSSPEAFSVVHRIREARPDLYEK